MVNFNEKMKQEIKAGVDKTSKNKLKALQERISETERRIQQLNDDQKKSIESNDFDNSYELDKEIASMRSKLEYMRQAESEYELGACLTHEQIHQFREDIKTHYDPMYEAKVQKVKDRFEALVVAYSELVELVDEEAGVLEYMENEGELYRARISCHSNRNINKNVGLILNNESVSSLKTLIDRLDD